MTYDDEVRQVLHETITTAQQDGWRVALKTLVEAGLLVYRYDDQVFLAPTGATYSEEELLKRAAPELAKWKSYLTGPGSAS